ncbi:MAG: MaoC family dehydratase [Acidocella sp.]|nr:MaoC family dehydratase [Acidocella sp.]
MDYKYFEDFAPGQVFETPPEEMIEAEIIEFAAKFDPQPMHTDPVAAMGITGGLIASGWHTASMTMRLLITSGLYNPAPGTLGMGFERLVWKKPVRPGDWLRLRFEVLSVRESASRPDLGIVTSRFTTLNHNDDHVQEMISSALLPRRPK